MPCWRCTLSSAATPAGRHEYLLLLLQIRQDPQVIRLARRRARDPELAQDALQQAFDMMARVKNPDAIEDPRAYFCRVLIRAINSLRGQLGAVLADEFASIADACQVGVLGAPARPIDETVTVSLLTRGALERLSAEREALTAAVPARSPDPRRYREVIVDVAGQVLRSIVEFDVCDADGNAALRAAYPEWFAADGGQVGNAHQRFSRARADVRTVLRMIITRDDLYP